MMRSLIIFICLITLLISFGCDSNEIEDSECTKFISLLDDSLSYEIDIPDHIIRAVRSGGYYDESLELIDLPSNTKIESSIDDNKAILGRVLFYDKQLSKDNTISCASCHIQTNSFAEPRKVSVGINNAEGGRNSMNLENVIFYPSSGGYGWGEGSALLEDQIKAALLNPIEMDMTEQAIIDKVSSNCYYEALYSVAYGGNNVTSSNIYEAIAHFIGSMTAYNSKYDDGRVSVNSANDDFPNFTPLENAGKQVFNINCASCHSLEVFKGASPTNIGLDLVYVDKGLGLVTGDPSDNGKFKTPSIRNIMVSSPYMHDGRFETIDEVLEFYSEDIENHPNLDPLLKNSSTNQPIKFMFEDFEINQLKAFLKTLTDNSFLEDPKFSDPF